MLHSIGGRQQLVVCKESYKWCVCLSVQETLATLNLGAAGGELSDRNKRTIGILRQLFPTLTQVPYCYCLSYSSTVCVISSRAPNQWPVLTV